MYVHGTSQTFWKCTTSQAKPEINKKEENQGVQEKMFSLRTKRGNHVMENETKSSLSEKSFYTR